MGSYISDAKIRQNPEPITGYLASEAGRPALVLGGGPSVAWALAPWIGLQLPDDPVVISANDHGVRLSDAGLCRRPDYLVCVDQLEKRLRPHQIPIIARREWADIELFQRPVGTSGELAAWVAWVLGCSPILLLGMDLYSSGTYYDAPDAQSTGRRIPVSQHLERWQRLPGQMPGAQLRVPPGSILAGERGYAVWDPEEPPAPLPDRALVRDAVRGERIRYVRRHPALVGYYEPGTEREVSQREFNRLTRQRVAVPA